MNVRCLSFGNVLKSLGQRKVPSVGTVTGERRRHSRKEPQESIWSGLCLQDKSFSHFTFTVTLGSSRQSPLDAKNFQER